MARNLCLVLVVATVVCFSLIECKSPRRTHAVKKVLQAKPTKGPKSILESFKGLPEEDLAFIKQLDKQFKKFGDNVKIKVQRENRTVSAKNSKRTIDRSLGYGYQGSHENDQRPSYTFSKPKFEVYPYSQHDIPASQEYQQQQHNLHYLRNYPVALTESDANYYHNQNDQEPRGHTSVEIQASHSYEIKQTDDGYKTVFDGHDGQQHQVPEVADYRSHAAAHDEAVPVIVLRIPGPSKYAEHLRALLQQYLELRAAQYIQELQEQEASSHAHSSEQVQYDHSAYQQAIPSAIPALSTAHYQPQTYLASPMWQPLHVATPAHIVASAAPAYYNPQANLALQHTDDSHSAEHQTGYVQPTAYEYHNIHDVGHEASHEHHQEHHLHSDEHAHDEHTVYGTPHHETAGADHHGLVTTENFPDDKHTQVVFKSTTASPLLDDSHELEHHEQRYQPPATQINTYRAPLVYHKLEAYYNQPYDGQSGQEEAHQGDEHAGYDENAQPITSVSPKFVPITQRPAVLPYNYHAQLHQLAHYGQDLGYDYGTQSAEEDQLQHHEHHEDEGLYKRNSNKKRRQSISREDRYRKMVNIAQRMKSRMTAVKQTKDDQVTE